MARVSVNYHVKVFPHVGYMYENDPVKRGNYEQGLALEIEKAIERHVDDVGYMVIGYDNLCSGCGSIWEKVELDDPDPCFCCDLQMKEWEEEKLKNAKG